MNKSELIVFRYKEAADLDFQDTYLASSSYGLKLGLEFSGDPTNVIQVVLLLLIRVIKISILGLMVRLL
jgi:hypothetical protein